jgi:BirA family biotin operon repressor/biotin-[acetyl-CoA-carboxylase] ligase
VTGSAAHRAAVRLGRPLVRVEEVESTNDLARLLAAGGLPEGATVVAGRQTRGRGRFGRAWISPPGGLWCSLLLRPAADAGWGWLSLATAVAVAEAVERAAGARSTIRWPNDVLIGGRKVAGVLIEVIPDAVVIGVGINANVDPGAFPDDLRAPVTSLVAAVGRPVALVALLETLLERCTSWYDAWSRRDPAVAAAWSDRDATRGTHVSVRGPGAMVEGWAEGVDVDGALLLRLSGGEIQRVIAGDLIASPASRQEPS